MTDREMLELAAKAAGIDWFDEPAASLGKGLHLKSGSFWNPRTDDGDALRLAVKLAFTVGVWDGYVDVLTTTTEGWRENCTSDPYAATRRAIVRAAAEIGKDVK
jgi:hypothetical protein